MDVVCGDGLCPFVPCKDCPNCVHVDGVIVDKDAEDNFWGE